MTVEQRLEPGTGMWKSKRRKPAAGDRRRGCMACARDLPGGLGAAGGEPPAGAQFRPRGRGKHHTRRAGGGAAWTALRLLDKKNSRRCADRGQGRPGLDLFDEKDNLSVVLGAEQARRGARPDRRKTKSVASRTRFRVRLCDKDGRTRARSARITRTAGAGPVQVLALDKDGTVLDLFDENDKGDRPRPRNRARTRLLMQRRQPNSRPALPRLDKEARGSGGAHGGRRVRLAIRLFQRRRDAPDDVRRQQHDAHLGFMAA